MYKIRKAIPSDIHVLKELFQTTILTINRKDYSLDETKDWASCGDNTEKWIELLTEQYCIVMENENNTIVGFASINTLGYIHMLFVHKDFQNRGIATSLYQYLENYIRMKGVERITSEVSITAKPFFEKQGFRIDKAQKRQANRLLLRNYKMSKKLN